MKKMVEAYGGSPEWKPDFFFVRAFESYCLPWNLRETEGLGALKDEWTQEDKECIEELEADVEKILKYSKVVKWNDVQYYVPPAYAEEENTANVMSSSNVGSRLFGDEDSFTTVNSDEDVTITAAPQKKKKKRIVKVGDRVKSKKVKTDAPSKETTPLGSAPATSVGSSVWCPGENEFPENIASFPGDVPAILAKGPSEEDPIPDVPDEYMGIELEDADEATEEDVADTGHSGVQRTVEDASQDPSKDLLQDSWSVHRVHLMVLSEEQSTMDILKEKAHEIKLLTDYIAKLQNLLQDNNIDFEAFEHPEEIVDPQTRSSREELLMRVHAQDLEIVDLKDKLNQCVNLLSLHGYKSIIHPSPDNPVREVLVRA
ncbi:OLC1v1008700C1 [Oldenlandia corymbosa var. corymbosa]|uniref:OLC1v1008700C1 n=1 Tax=Oldenlandia corymbosa var. corymbosa TaxID=529605 RepID=A0AAV1DQF6_OLDCO|nr:OLC1v1008700C1 [Oldenlandia corymbosa var. corymbosa]